MKWGRKGRLVAAKWKGVTPAISEETNDGRWGVWRWMRWEREHDEREVGLVV